MMNNLKYNNLIPLILWTSFSFVTQFGCQEILINEFVFQSALSLYLHGAIDTFDSVGTTGDSFLCHWYTLMFK